MARTRSPCSSASTSDATNARVCKSSPAERVITCCLPDEIPLLPDEVKILDQMLGAEIASLFEKE